jgi:transposase
MTNYREILRLNSLGILKQDIAIACGCSRNTVANVTKIAREQGLKWETAERLSSKELGEKLFPGNMKKAVYKIPDWEYVHREMAKNGVTLSLLWAEYCEQCRGSGEIPYQTTQFYYYYAEYVQKTKATMRISHKPGEIMEVDWAGQNAFIRNTDTGGHIKAHIFVAVLPYSGYTYVEAFLSQDQESWIQAHINAYGHFGGVTRVLVPDNLKTGIVKHTRHETVVNKAYQEMAEHYRTAVIPARVRAPKDKATVEGNVGIISTWITAALRNQQFLSLWELNTAIHAKLTEFNNKPFQKKEGSRAAVFEEERTFMLPLPEYPYELATWKIATVQFNYHITTENGNYSVPYEYIKQKVNVRLTKRLVEVFFAGNRVASHPRLYGRPGQYSTCEEHMPKNHREYVAWNGERFLSWAGKIGAHAKTIVQIFISRNQIEQQGYKACIRHLCRALLKLSDTYSASRLEKACARALSFTERPSLKTIQIILKSGQDNLPTDEPVSNLPETSGSRFTRGREYYQQKEGN